MTEEQAETEVHHAVYIHSRNGDDTYIHDKQDNLTDGHGRSVDYVQGFMDGMRAMKMVYDEELEWRKGGSRAKTIFWVVLSVLCAAAALLSAAFIILTSYRHEWSWAKLGYVGGFIIYTYLSMAFWGFAKEE